MAINLPKPIDDRVQSLLNAAMAMHQSGSAGPAAQKGAEREVFISHVLKEALPQTIRFGTGSVSDLQGNESGQLDIVLEGDVGISFSMPGVPDHRFYLANSVGAVIEVKSDLSANTWNEAVDSAERLAKVKRSSGSEWLASIIDGDIPLTTPSGAPASSAATERMRSGALKRIKELEAQPTQIPFYIVSYEGWKTAQTLADRLSQTNHVDGVFIIKSGLWAVKDRSKDPTPVYVNTGHAQLVNFMTRLGKDCQLRYESISQSFGGPS